MNFFSFSLRLLQTTLVGGLFVVFLGIPQHTGLMAGKVYAIVGEKISISLADIPSNTDISWTLSKDGTIVETKTGKSYSSSFASSGEYLLRVSALGKDGFQSATVIEISVGSSLPNFSPLKAVLKTVPPAENGILSLGGQEAKVTFSFLESTGEIESFSLEGDMYSDSDSDGIIDNDVENKSDISFHSGSYFQKTYKNDGIPKKAVLTVKNKKGETSTASVMIRFTEGASKANAEKQQNPLSAILESIPKSNAQGNIPLSGKPSSVLLYASESNGKIQEYRLDLNDKEDSNKDGNFTNDPDNAGSDSFTSGSVFPIAVSAENLPKTITLTVVDVNGATKSVQKTIFVDPSAASGPNSGSEFLTPMLFASRSKIVAGETAVFKLFNIAPESTISWDFNGDGKWEIEKSNDTEVEFKYSEGGTYNVRAEITQVGASPIFTKSVIEVISEGKTKIKTEEPIAHFLAQKEGNKVSFLSSESHADENLLDTKLSYTWDFGDGYKTEGPNPIHIYEKAGVYTVVLTIEDSIERQAVFTDAIEITETSTPFDKNQHGGPASLLETIKNKAEEVIDAKTLPQTQDPTNPENQESQSSSLMIPWWLALIILLPFLPVFYIIKLKIDNPEKDIHELTTEMIVRIKGLFTPKPKEEELTLESLGIVPPAPENTPPLVTNAPTPEAQNPNAETPEWMRKYDETEIKKASSFDSPLDEMVQTTQQTVENVIPSMGEQSTQETNLQEQPLPEMVVPQENPVPETINPVPDWLQPQASHEFNTQSQAQPSAETFPVETEVSVPQENSLSENIAPVPDWLQPQPQTFEESEPSFNASSQNQETPSEITPQENEEDTLFAIENENIAEEENTIFTTKNHPEWLQEILISQNNTQEKEAFSVSTTDFIEPLEAKNEWTENDDDIIFPLASSQQSPTLPEVLPDEDEWWNEEDEWWHTEEDDNTKDSSSVQITRETDHSSTEAQGVPSEPEELPEELPEEVLIKAIDASIPVKEDSASLPTWIQK